METVLTPTQRKCLMTAIAFRAERERWKALHEMEAAIALGRCKRRYRQFRGWIEMMILKPYEFLEREQEFDAFRDTLQCRMVDIQGEKPVQFRYPRQAEQAHKILQEFSKSMKPTQFQEFFDEIDFLFLTKKQQMKLSGNRVRDKPRPYKKRRASMQPA